MGAGRLRRSRRCLERCELSELALDLGDIEGEQEGWPGDGLDFGSGVMGRVTVKDKLLVGVTLKGSYRVSWRKGPFVSRGGWLVGTSQVREEPPRLATGETTTRQAVEQCLYHIYGVRIEMIISFHGFCLCVCAWAGLCL